MQDYSEANEYKRDMFVLMSVELVLVAVRRKMGYGSQRITLL